MLPKMHSDFVRRVKKLFSTDQKSWVVLTAGYDGKIKAALFSKDMNAIQP